MKTATFELELLTPCFCGGAEPKKQAEIRAPSIRGQLRWWFRVLGGFSSLAQRGMNLRDQEAMIFGSTAGDEGKAGKLLLRIKNGPAPTRITRDDQEFNANVGTDKGYLAFPLRSKRDRKTGAVIKYGGRAVYDPVDNQNQLFKFNLEIIWKGEVFVWDDLRALVALYGHLGSLGFRSRRAFGALGLLNNEEEYRLGNLIQKFDLFFRDRTENKQLFIFEVKKRPGENAEFDNKNADDCIITLAKWLKDWRSHGRSIDHPQSQPPDPPYNEGFYWARIDHDIGVRCGQGGGNNNEETYRPSLGLPIIQFFSSGHPQINWNEKYDPAKRQRDPQYNGEGRFASPVILRPYRDANGQWHALVIFVEARKWPENKVVYLNGKQRNVSLKLYEAMKNDERLTPFLE